MPDEPGQVLDQFSLDSALVDLQAGLGTMTPPMLQRELTTDGVRRCAAMGAASDWGWVHMLGWY